MLLDGTEEKKKTQKSTNNPKDAKFPKLTAGKQLRDQIFQKVRILGIALVAGQLLDDGVRQLDKVLLRVGRHAVDSAGQRRHAERVQGVLQVGLFLQLL